MPNITLLEAAKPFQGSASDPQPGQMYSVQHVLGEELIALRRAIAMADAEDYTDPAWVYDNLAMALGIARSLYQHAETMSGGAEVNRELRERFANLSDEIQNTFSRDYGLGVCHAGDSRLDRPAVAG